MTRSRSGNLRGSYRQLPSGRYQYAQWVKELSRSVYGTGESESKAKKAFDKKLLALLSSDRAAAPTKMTFLEYAERVIRERDGISQRTIDKYSYELKKYLVPLHHLHLEQVTPSKLTALQTYLREEGYSLSVRLHVHTLVRLVMEHALKIDKHVTSNPASDPRVRPRKLRGEKAIPKVFTPEQSALILKHFGDVLHGEILAMLLLTGMRRGELVALQWKDIDFEQKIIKISKTRSTSNGKVYIGPPKTANSHRNLPINNQIVRILQQLREKQNLQHKALYPDRPSTTHVFATLTGTAPRPDNVRRTLHQIYDRVDSELKAQGLPLIPRHPPHALRHTFVSTMAAAGHTIKRIAYWIGDDPITVIKVYEHLLNKSEPIPEFAALAFLISGEESENS